MVDLFTGDFKYNIPLLDVGGYPLNLAYKSGTSADQEASWVGLGWNLNVGAIVRNMRGIPDEFNGEDEIVTEMHRKPNETWRVNLGRDFELLGKETNGINVGLGISFNNYTGFGMNWESNLSFTTPVGSENQLTGGLGLSSDSKTGTTVNPSVSFSRHVDNDLGFDTRFVSGIYSSVNSRTGLRGLTMQAGLTGAIGNRGQRSFGMISRTANLQFADPAYVPVARFPIQNTAHSISFKLGTETSFAALNGLTVRGMYEKQALSKTSESTPAYGYLNLESGQSEDNVLLDFNREKDGAYTKNTPHLPLTNLTYDTYMMTGQGLSGSFRAHRGDVGIVFDPGSEVLSTSTSSGVEVAFGNDAKAGFDLAATFVEARTGAWRNDNDLWNKVVAQAAGPNGIYEKAAFRMMGEQVKVENAFFDDRGGFEAIRPVLSGLPEVKAKAEWATGTSNSNGQTISSNNIQRNERIVRNTNISFLSADETKAIHPYAQIRDYNLSGDGITDFGQLDRVNTTVRKAHHPGSVNVTSTDGSRYEYAVPAYNNFQWDVSYTSGSEDYTSNPSAIQSGDFDMADYESNMLNTKKGEGRDHYFQGTQTPAYAHSYLLSGYFSHDYQDKTGNGPSPDDLGSYAKFNYGRAHQAFKWRTPYSTNGDEAKNNRGFRSDPTDDRATFSWGEKEIWYLKSIESRDYIAVFRMSERQDALGSTNEHGGKNTTDKLQKVDRIDLYSRREYLADPNVDPIKSVHFIYDYSLCQNLPNNSNQTDQKALANQGGKLTLKGLYFTYYNSTKGKLNHYAFEYSSQNPDYDPRSYDRWGTYAPPINAGFSTPDNADAPYTKQDASLAANYAESWCLNAINLPSGGRIEVTYE
ncbi:MAG: hypothetical protein AAF570_10840, partial [Bacteroidota bacterium]